MTTSVDAGPAVPVQLLLVPDCPQADEVRQRLRRVVASTGIRIELSELVGEFPSPTLLVGGVDVTGRPRSTGPACRLDLPDEAQIHTALSQAIQASEPL